jgi:hypothetical protein
MSKQHRLVICLATLLAFLNAFGTAAAQQGKLCAFPGQANLGWMTLMTLSLHHGVEADNGVPTLNDIHNTSAFLEQYFGKNTSNLILAIPAAPYPTRLNGSTGEELVKDLHEKYHWNVSYAQTNATALDWNNSALIAGANWKIESHAIEDYVKAGLGSPDGKAVPFEGAHFGNFLVSRNGVKLRIFTVQTDAESSHWKVRFTQLNYDVDYGASLGGPEPTLLVGDYNIRAAEAPSDVFTEFLQGFKTKVRLLTWCRRACGTDSTATAFSTADNVIHIGQVEGPTRLRPIANLTGARGGDPNSTIISVPGQNHPAVGVIFGLDSAPTNQVKPCLQDCPSGRTACASVCTNLNTDPANCGSCFAQCTRNTSCFSGECECESGMQDCGQSCVSLQTNQNCGGCGKACSGGLVCCGGAHPHCGPRRPDSECIQSCEHAAAECVANCGSPGCKQSCAEHEKACEKNCQGC